MNLDNVVLVRTMNHLPLNGELIPNCEAVCLKRDERSNFHYFINSVIRKELETKLGRVLTYEEEMNLLAPLTKQYSVYTSEMYTSTLSFSLNGMVPDDINCKFANMPLAVIDPIKNHTDANFVNIRSTDTTIKGRLKVSGDAILVINEEFYKSLSEEIKVNLASNYKIELFSGSLKDGIDNTLQKYNYPILPLIKTDEYNNNISECPERESMLSFEDEFAASVGASRLLLENIQRDPFFYTPEDQQAHDKIKEDFPNDLKLDEYHKKELYNFLIGKAESLGIVVTDEEKYYMFLDYVEGEEAMKRITSEVINAYGGLENFKAFILEYNEYIKNNCLTGVEAIALDGDTRK